jgi:hypothetical protein
MAGPGELGEQLSTHGIEPAYLQRAAFIAVLSFFFFMAMMLAYYIRGQIGYFLLATAFLIVYIFTMAGWFMRRKELVFIHAHGLSYKNRSILWNEVANVDDAGRIELRSGEHVELPASIRDRQRLIQLIRFRQNH